MNYLKIVDETSTEGDGIRLSVFLSGCENQCPGCFNPESWSYDAGKELTQEVIDSIIDKIKYDELVDGISILGGDPFAPGNREALSGFLRQLYIADIGDIWVWTGYTYEELIEDRIAKASLYFVDYLVDGRFVKNLKTTEMKFRGSSNQRIIKLKRDSIEIESIS